LIAPQFPMDAFKVPDELRFTVDDWVAVVDRAIQLVGEDHVALGSDFDGGPTLPRGMRDIQKFLGGNLLRVFRQITEKSSI